MDNQDSPSEGSQDIPGVASAYQVEGLLVVVHFLVLPVAILDLEEPGPVLLEHQAEVVPFQDVVGSPGNPLEDSQGSPEVAWELSL